VGHRAVGPGGGSPGDAFERLVALMARLRDPGGCPWDRDQTHDSIKGHLIEEAYESVDALDSGRDDRFAEELGDLLLQIVFHARMAAERGAFEITDVIDGIVAKIERRHPHIFGDARADTPADVLVSWERIKRDEKKGKSVLSGLPADLPALMYSQKLQHKAAHVGFDWGSDEPVYAKLEEEIAELKEAAASGDRKSASEELGDVLFTAVNLGRRMGLDAEMSLRAVAAKFKDRFQRMEQMAAGEGHQLAEMSLAEQDALWERAKAEERRPGSGRDAEERRPKHGRDAEEGST
jgi:tetrapyrrole methylase family protein / MazG family protein